MRIIDPHKNIIGLGSDANKETVGIVLKTPDQFDNTPMLGVIIPKFMMGYEYKDGDKAKDETLPISGSKCVNDASCKGFWGSSITIKNYISVRPLLNQNQSMPNYVVGDKVIVSIIDNDIKTLAFLPYSINRLGQRATDKAMFSVPANPKENQALTEENTYFIKIDSEKKVIMIVTNDKNGETCAQTIGLDAGNGQIAITDNKERTWMLDTQNDSITSITSGTKIEQVGNVINIEADQININGQTSITTKTSVYKAEADTLTSKASSTTYEFDTFKQTSSSGEWKVTTEKHDGMAASFKGSTFHVDDPVIGLNGGVVFPAFTIGAIPNINAPVPPTAGASGPQGSMVMQTDPAATPLAKFPQLSACIMAIAAAADMYPSGAGSATAAAANFVSAGMTTKMMSS